MVTKSFVLGTFSKEPPPDKDASFIIGVDPGFTGALALLKTNCAPDRRTALAEVWDMPLRPPSPLFGASHNQVDAHALADILGPMLDLAADLGNPIEVWLEKVSAGPQDGRTSAFRFGEGFGIIQGVLGGLGFDARSIHYTLPSVWKPAMNVTSDKKTSLAQARQFFGTEHFPLVKHHGRAEAALIALYGAQVGSFKTKGKDF